MWAATSAVICKPKGLMSHSWTLALQNAFERNSLKADLAQRLAAAIMHGNLPHADGMGILQEMYFPMGWMTAARADTNTEIPFSHLVRRQKAAGCTPGDCREH